MYFYDIVIPANYAKAFKYFQKVANKNHPGGLYHLGILYLDLYRSTNENDQSYLRKSLYYIQKSSDQSFTPACYVLGRLWIEKNDIPVKIEKIIHYFEIASSVFSESYFYLGYIYQSYLLDLNKAKYYFKIASDHHHSTSMYLLASIILEESSISGNTVQDMNHAIYYLELSAQQNNSEAQFLLGSIYLENETVYNLDKAIHYFQLATSQNHVKFQHILGLIYFKYQFMASDLQKAIYYFKLAASQNYSHAQFYLGLIYTHLVSPPQIQTSLYYYELAAQQNHSNALFCLGLIYYSDGSLHDLKKAAYYFELASKSNSPYANFYLALMYYDGIIFPNDNAKAAYYLELSLQEFFIQKTTDITFMNTLFLAGVIYFENTYLEQSHEKALKYFHIWIKAKEKLDSENIILQYPNSDLVFPYYTCGLINAIIFHSIAKSKEYFLKAEYLDFPEIYHSLGIIFYFYDNDFRKSKLYLKKAIKHNFILSEIILAIIYEMENNIDKAVKHYIRVLQMDNIRITVYNQKMCIACINTLTLYTKIKLLVLSVKYNIQSEARSFIANLEVLDAKHIHFLYCLIGCEDRPIPIFIHSKTLECLIEDLNHIFLVYPYAYLFGYMGYILLMIRSMMISILDFIKYTCVILMDHIHIFFIMKIGN
ncbi:hypothetical protein TRFO_39971 [Tritrichomonas foetus]|uniref:Uncharacterized protein n=1 Tax=Tritrichomonas foetus TaxID=1144522 RepID=A0A1J4J2R4_9EUKA|nr:hypothetical protein TRFO_39971 [Tritrichomonas foetus]|eukprot:OHS93736.1 hypothetical protein TRFO_39971 [Tritrichomonas foetus]